MPGIVLFRRRWNIASDDFFLPAVLLLISHFVWVIVLIIGVVVGAALQQTGSVGDNTTGSDSSVALSCHSSLRQLLIAHLTLSTLSAIVKAILVVVTLRGTVWDAKPRSSVRLIVYARLGLLVAEFAAVLPSIAWFSTCSSGSFSAYCTNTLLGIIFYDLLVVVSVCAGFYATFDPAGKYWVEKKPLESLLQEKELNFTFPSKLETSQVPIRKCTSSANSRVHRNCQDCSPCKKEDSFLNLAKFFHKFFSDYDLAPTDVMAGLILLERYQNQLGSNDPQQETPTSDTGSAFNRVTEVDTPELKLAHYWLKYIRTGYQWTSGRKRSAKSCCLQKSFVSFPPFSGNTEVTLTYRILSSYAPSNKNELPFFVAVDYDQQKIVLCICNLCRFVEEVTMGLIGGNQSIPLAPKCELVANKEMLETALCLWEKLNTERILEVAFAHKTDRGTQNFQLVITGHSLAAGAAALAAILLRKQFPTLHCFAYSPPGSLLNSSAMEYTRSFVTTVVHWDDVIPRFGVQQVEKLRLNLVTAIRQSNKSKWTIFRKKLLRCSTSNADDSIAQINSDAALLEKEPMYLPGRIIAIAKDKSLRKQPCYKAFYSEAREFQKILISPGMLREHNPCRIQRALSKILSSKEENTFIKFPDIATPSENFRLLETPPTPQKRLQPRSRVLDLSLTSIENSPALDERGLGYVRHSPSISSIADRNHAIYSRDEDECHVFANLLVAAIATPETLSDASSPSSVQSSVRPSRKPLDPKVLADKLSPDPCSSSSSKSDNNEPTEGSSVYCLSPLSSVRSVRHSGQQRAHLKREILRLYQRAAADVRESSSPQPGQRQLTAIKSEAASGASTPVSGSPTH